MFYFGEIAALTICWLFYCEIYWTIERRVIKACSRQRIDRQCKTLTDRLFFTPVSGKAKLGMRYYINRLLVYSLTFFTAFHLTLGWNEALQGLIRVVTTVFVIALGAVAVANSAAATEYICANSNISSKRNIFLFKTISIISEIILIAVYLYFAWVYII